MYIDFIADYGGISGQDDLAFSEVDRVLVEEFLAQGLGIPVIKNLSVRAFNTTETGFYAAQLGYLSRLGKGHIIYTNTAPRQDDLNGRTDNAGEFLAVSQLENGVRLIGIYGGNSFAFIDAPVYRVKCADKGSQFRSRDVFPVAVASLATLGNKDLSDWELLGDKIENKPLPEQVIAAIDGYGNIKTTLTQLPENVSAVKINGLQYPVIIKTGIFDVPQGALTLAHGSSGWHQKFYEIVLRGANAAKRFNNPVPGDKIELIVEK